MDIDRLVDKIGHDLGWNETNMMRERPYNGQPHTITGVRGSTEIKGVTFRDLRDSFIRAYILSHQYYKNGTLEKVQPNAALCDEAKKGEFSALCEDDLYQLIGNIDPIAFCQNLSIEVEKTMGIYPNIPKLHE